MYLKEFKIFFFFFFTNLHVFFSSKLKLSFFIKHDGFK